MPPGEIVEGLTAPPEDNPFARLFAGRARGGAAGDILNPRYEVDLNDPRSYERQMFDQVCGLLVLCWVCICKDGCCVSVCGLEMFGGAGTA